MVAVVLVQQSILPSLETSLELKTASTLPSTFDSKVLIYITTVYSDVHRQYLACCWPRLLAQSNLFRKAHFIMFSNNVTQLDDVYLMEVKTMFLSYGVQSFEFKFADGTHELQVLQQMSREEKMESQKSKKVAKQLQKHSMAKQWGANMAMSIGISQGWFQSYDWMARINPDVLIRQSDFIVHHVDDPLIDAIVAPCESDQVNTDFFAVRPSALPSDAFEVMQDSPTQTIYYPGMPRYNHEVTARTNFRSILEQKRYTTVPNLARMKKICRVRGNQAPVYHAHDSKSSLWHHHSLLSIFILKNTVILIRSPLLYMTGCSKAGDNPMVCNALENWDIR